MVAYSAAFMPLYTLIFMLLLLVILPYQYRQILTIFCSIYLTSPLLVDIQPSDIFWRPQIQGIRGWPLRMTSPSLFLLGLQASPSPWATVRSLPLLLRLRGFKRLRTGFSSNPYWLQSFYLLLCFTSFFFFFFWQ